MYDAWKKKVMPDTTRIYYIDTWFLSQNLPYYQPETLTSFTKTKVHCRSAIRPGASGLPCYCAPLVCVPTVIGVLIVWWHNKLKIKNHLWNWLNWKFVSESEVIQKKKHFLFSLVLFLKLDSSAVSFKFPKFGRQLPPFMGVATFLGTALRSGASCQGKQKMGVKAKGMLRVCHGEQSNFRIP